MDTVEKIILQVVANSPNQTLTGRTLLQKTIYFVNEMEQLGICFRPHYYGPYSDAVADATASLVARGALRELAESLPTNDDPFEARRYVYELKDLGKVMLAKEADHNVDKACKSSCQTIWNETTDYNELAAASKLYHILRNHGPLTHDSIATEAKELGWHLSPQQVEKAVQLLLRLFGREPEEDMAKV